MRRRTLLAATGGLLATRAAAQPADAATRAELAPSGTLRVGIGVGPAASAFWALRQPDGSPRGVTVTLAEEAARRLGLPLQVVAFPSSGAVTEAGASAPPGWDLSFMPVDAERAARVAFGPDYYLSVSTYLVAGNSPLRHADDANRDGVRVGGVAGTTTLRAAQRAHPRATFVATAGLDEMVAKFQAGEVDAVALGRESLESLLPRLSGARIVDGHFHALGTAVAVPRGRPLALAWATAFIEAAKADGTVRRALDGVGIGGPVAPAGSRTAGA
ncbi:transporter substrate-binding domain-containing protein [Falsiroseomonas sp. CW058]|uniref:transporter substrate-binding domain-containing protein n=1 Tax=Falsiroseomonas sp. CW058 TaxID=3388664 RepID=UPI003D31486D